MEHLTPKEFVEKVAEMAVADYPNSRILPSVVIAQAILETGWGKSKTMTRFNAIFGIKATKDWTGACYSVKTKEYYDGRFDTPALFRAYGSLEECFQDHTKVCSLPRYEGVIGGMDYKKVCLKLQEGEYSTEPDYADTLVKGIIVPHRLYQYDEMALALMPDVTALPNPESIG